MPYHIHIDSCKPDDALLREAAQAVIRGGIIIYPTETVYGIGALYSHDQALIRVFSCKGRDTSKPILLLIRDFNDLDMIAADVSEKALCLARACWPGPVTLLFKAAPNLSRLLTGAQAKIGCRISSNHIAQKLVEYVGAPITSTSANLSGNASASNIKLLDNVLYNLVDVVIDAGDTGSNVASTIIDVSGEPFTVVRKGTILPDLSVYL